MRLFLLLFILLLPLSTSAQRPPADLWARWEAGQVAVAERYRVCMFIEEADRRYDGPFGQRRVRTTQEMHTPVRGEGQGEQRWRLRLHRVEVNDRPLPPEEHDRTERFLMRHRLELTVGLMPLHTFTADQFRQEGAVREERGPRLWRVDLMPTGTETLVEYATLWFVPETDRLHRSRLVVRPREHDMPLIVEMEYRRVNGLDVPLRRRAEGAVRVERRTRTYTMLFQQQTQYRDFRFRTTSEP